VLSAAMRLQQADFNVVRINLRDHGDTAGLNEELFNSARISEVIALVQQLAAGYTDFGLMGFSLGGNFALRVARATKVPTLAICPAIDPALTMKCIDSGLAVYRLYFLHKWRRALAAKAAAFPRAYDFTEAFGLRSVQTLTDLFVNRFSEFSTTAEYFSHYDLRLDALAGVDAMVVATQDDPVVPAAQFAGLPTSLAIDLVATGGHCALLKNWRLESYCDDVAERFFRDRLLT